MKHALILGNVAAGYFTAGCTFSGKPGSPAAASRAKTAEKAVATLTEFGAVRRRKRAGVHYAFPPRLRRPARGVQKKAEMNP